MRPIASNTASASSPGCCLRKDLQVRVDRLDLRRMGADVGDHALGQDPESAARPSSRVPRPIADRRMTLRVSRRTFGHLAEPGPKNQTPTAKPTPSAIEANNRLSVNSVPIDAKTVIIGSSTLLPGVAVLGGCPKMQQIVAVHPLRNLSGPLGSESLKDVKT